MSSNLVENDQIVEMLSLAIKEGDSGLDQVPALINRVIDDGSWQERVVRKTGEIVRFERFVDFVTTPPLEGLGASVATLERLCGNELAVWNKIEGLLQEQSKQGERNDLVYNVHEVNPDTRPAGNNRRAAIRRLRKDRPDLLDKVIAKELSPHAAMLEAGFRVRKVAVNMEDATSAAETLMRHMDHELLTELIDILGERLEANGAR